MLKVSFAVIVATAIGGAIWASYESLERRLLWLHDFYRHRRVQKLCREQWPETLLLMASALRAGITLNEAFQIMVKEAPSPLQESLRRRLKHSPEWMTLADQAAAIFAEPYLAILKRSFVLASQTGASYIPVLQSQAQTLRRKQIMAHKVAALTAQSQMSAWIVGLSPVALAIVLWISAPEFILPFFRSSLGSMFLAAALVLNSVGFVVIRWMLRFDE